MKTFDEILQNHYIHNRGLNNPEYVRNAAFEYARQVAESVREECAKKAKVNYEEEISTGEKWPSTTININSILSVDVEQFIK